MDRDKFLFKKFFDREPENVQMSNTTYPAGEPLRTYQTSDQRELEQLRKMKSEIKRIIAQYYKSDESEFMERHMIMKIAQVVNGDE